VAASEGTRTRKSVSIILCTEHRHYQATFRNSTSRRHLWKQSIEFVLWKTWGIIHTIHWTRTILVFVGTGKGQLKIISVDLIGHITTSWPLDWYRAAGIFHFLLSKLALSAMLLSCNREMSGSNQGRDMDYVDRGCLMVFFSSYYGIMPG
jgi:hypothetical protein